LMRSFRRSGLFCTYVIAY